MNVLLLGCDPRWPTVKQENDVITVQVKLDNEKKAYSAVVESVFLKVKHSLHAAGVVVGMNMIKTAFISITHEASFRST